MCFEKKVRRDVMMNKGIEKRGSYVSEGLDDREKKERKLIC